MSERFLIEISNETVERLIVELFLPFEPIVDIDTRLKNIPHYTDFKLWVIVESVRLSRNEKASLLCVEALVELRQRGYDVKNYVQKYLITTTLSKSSLDL